MLRWSEPAAGTAQPYQVEHARESDFSDAEVIYVGRMPSAHVSGLRDGVHRFRVRVTDAPNAAAGTSVARRSDLPNWSAPAVLRVEHHSMLVVWPLMALGASVFLATAGFVARHAGAQGRSA